MSVSEFCMHLANVKRIRALEKDQIDHSARVDEMAEAGEIQRAREEMQAWASTLET